MVELYFHSLLGPHGSALNELSTGTFYLMHSFICRSQWPRGLSMNRLGPLEH
jgi:hypothetical protein